MAFTYTQLRSEIQTDPAALGYAGKTPEQQLALLNALPGPAGETVNVTGMTPQAFGQSMVESEWAALTVQQCLYLVMLALTGSINPNNATVKAGVLAIFGAGTTTRANLSAALTRTCSRAEFLWGAGTVIGPNDLLNVTAGAA